MLGWRNQRATDIVMNFCIPTKVSETSEGTRWRCARCDFSDVDRAGHFPDRIHPPPCRIQRRGLGDFIGSVLAKVGVTKQNWARWTGKLVEEQKAGCNECHSREIRINNLGWAWQDRVNRAGWWVRHRWTWISRRFACRRDS